MTSAPSLTQWPLVSLVVLNCNGLEDTRCCLRSLLEDDYTNVEIIVWDNGSTQDEAAMLRREFGDAIMTARSPRNLGCAGGYNAGGALAKGKYIAFLNNDIEVMRGWLAAIVAEMEAFPGVAVSQPKVRSWYARDEFDFAGGAGGYLDAFGYPFMRGRVLETVERDEGQYDDMVSLDWGGAAAMVTRADAYRAAGGFDERFFSYMEEVDLCWRLRSAGWRILAVPASLIFHKGGQVWKKSPFRKQFHAHRNNLMMLAKNVSYPKLIPIIGGRIALDLATAVYFFLRGDWPFAFAPLAAIPAFFVRLPAMLHEQRIRGAMPSYRGCVIWSYFVRGKRACGQLLPASVSSVRSHTSPPLPHVRVPVSTRH